MFLHRSEALSTHADMFSKMLSLVQLKERIPIVVTSLFPDVLNDTKFLRSSSLVTYLHLILKILFWKATSNIPVTNKYLVCSCRTVDLFHDSDENDFDAIVARMEISVADVMMELGYGCTSDTSKCKEVLSIFLPFTEVTLARILGMVVRTHAGLEVNTTTLSSFLMEVAGKPISDLRLLRSWDANVLVNSIKQLVRCVLILLCAS